MVLLTLIDAKYQFFLVDFGTNGHVSDGGVLQNTCFCEKLVEKNIHMPPSGDVTWLVLAKAAIIQPTNGM